MAITDTKKIDFLWKKTMFGVANTWAPDSNGLSKDATNETNASPMVVFPSNIWLEAANISIPAGASTAYIQKYSEATANTILCTEDISVSGHRTWKTGLTNWIPPSVDPTYLITVHAGNPGSGGVQLNSGTSSYEWVFDYVSGILTFPNTVPTTIANGSASIYIQGWRYIGATGAGTGYTFNTPGTSGSDFNVSVVGTNVTYNLPDAGLAARGVVTTGTQSFAGSKTFQDNVTISGNLTVSGITTTINATNLVVSDKNIVLNQGGTTAGTTGAGISIAGDANAEVGYFKINPTSNQQLVMKAPGYAGKWIVTVGGASDIFWRLPLTAGSSGNALITDGTGNLSWSNGIGHVIQGNQTPFTQRPNLNFKTAENFTVTDNAGNSSSDIGFATTPTFYGMRIQHTGGTPGTIVLYDGSGNPLKFIGLRAPTVSSAASGQTYILPVFPSTTGKVLGSDTIGQMSWVDPGHTIQYLGNIVGPEPRLNFSSSNFTVSDAPAQTRINVGFTATPTFTTINGITLTTGTGTLTLGANTLTVSGPATITGTNTGDQTITLTGNVTGSGTGSFSTTIANSAVTYAKIQNVSATDKVLGRSTAGAGVVEEITFTGAARTFAAAVDAAAERTVLGLGNAATYNIGNTAGSIAEGNHTHSEYQTLDTLLTNISALTTSADKLMYFTGSDTVALTSITSLGRAFVGYASSGEQRDALNLGITDSPTFANLTISNNVEIANDLVVTGDLTVIGTTSTVNTANLTVDDTFIILNNGEVGAGVTAGSSGIEIDRGSLDNYKIYFDETTDSLKIGDGNTYPYQKVATRQDSPISTGVAYWNDTDKRFDTVAGFTYASNTLTSPKFTSTVAIGTAPLTVTSTTVVTNLNADLLDGNEAAAFALSGHNHTGTYQPLDTTLTTIAALNPTTDEYVYFTALNTAAVGTITSFGRALLDDGSVAAQRTTLGLGNSATKDVGTGANDVAAGDHNHTVDSLSNVVITANSDNEILAWDSGTSKWINQTAAELGLSTSGDLSQFAATTSAQLAGVISDETGSGALVFADAPTLTDPVLGDASVTTVNKITITAPATGSTLTIQDGYTLTVSNDADVSGTNSGDQTIELTGDVTGSGQGTFAATLATVNTDTGEWGSATEAPVFTVNGKGLITAAANISLQIAKSQVTGLEADLAGKASNGANTDISSVVLNQTGLKIKGADNVPLTIKANETLTGGGKTLSIVTGDANRSLTLMGDVTLLGDNTVRYNRATVADANYAALDTDYIIEYTSISAARVVTLPTAVGVEGQWYTIKDGSGDASPTNTISVNTTSAQTIDEQVAPVVAIDSAYGAYILYSDGANWKTVSSSGGAVANLDDLTDVYIPTTPTKNYTLIYNGSQWVAAAAGTSFIFAISSFTCTAGISQNVEIGSGTWKTTGSISFSAAYSNGPATGGYVSHSGWSNLTLTGGSYLGPTASVSIVTYPVSVGGTKTFTLNATDGADPKTSTITYTFLNNRFWGKSSNTSLTEAQVEALSSELSNSGSKTFTITAGSGEYIYFASRLALGARTFTVNGFTGGFEAPQTVNITNPSGFAEDYYVYRSTNANLGATTVVVS